MTTTDYKSLPQAKALLDHLHSMNPGFDIEIIQPKKRWPDIAVRKSPEVMDIIRQHHAVSKNGLGNDIGLDAFVHRNRDADLWIHILDENKNIIGFSINEGYEVEKKIVNYFRVTIFNKDIQKLGIYPLLNELKVTILPADIFLVRTQNPVVYKYFTQMCEMRGLLVSPMANFINPAAVDIARWLIPEVDVYSVQHSALDGEALIDTPKPPTEHAPIWDRMYISKGDMVVILGYPELFK
ncbi:MAG: hypothetical protein HOD10_01950 [Candidatus Marinimicrobia bacterium]|jgi:hypothetical protein|nr:hypothetical protein [Candidatus Neomarinimicrobiota bacterium]